MISSLYTFKTVERGALPLPSSLVAQTVKNLPAMQEIWVRSLGGKDPLEKGMASHSVFMPGKFHGQRSQVGYNPWCRIE